jgi:hypothetical protein
LATWGEEEPIDISEIEAALAGAMTRIEVAAKV